MKWVISEREVMTHLLGIGLVISFVLPHTSTLLLLVNPMLFVIYQCFRMNHGLYRYNWIVVVPILFSMIVNLPQEVKMKAVMNCSIILMYFFCFPLVGKVRIPNAYLKLTLALIVFSQIVYIFHIPRLSDLLDTLYPIAEMDVHGVNSMRRYISLSNVMNYRLGGMYRDPNICAKSLTMLLAAFIALNYGKSLKTLLPFSAVCFLAVLGTGSRTGFVVAAAIVVIFLFLDRRIPRFWRWAALVAALGGLVFILTSRMEMRGLNVTQGFQNSANAKYLMFRDYLDHEDSLFRLLFGYMDYDRFIPTIANVIEKFDADYGYLIYCFGFVGFAAILIYFYTIFKRMDAMRYIVFVLLLWMFTSTIVMAYRSFFSFMLILSCVYNQHRKGAGGS